MWFRVLVLLMLSLCSAGTARAADLTPEASRYLRERLEVKPLVVASTYTATMSWTVRDGMGTYVDARKWAELMDDDDIRAELAAMDKRNRRVGNRLVVGGLVGAAALVGLSVGASALFHDPTVGLIVGGSLILAPLTVMGIGLLYRIPHSPGVGRFITEEEAKLRVESYNEELASELGLDAMPHPQDAASRVELRPYIGLASVGVVGRF